MIKRVVDKESRKRRPPYLSGIVIVLALVPVFGSYACSLGTEALIFAIAAMGLDVLIGFTGLVSFGHAAFFGVGAYATVIVGLSGSVWLGAAAGIVLATTAALIIGIFCVRSSGPAFFMLTLAFGQLLYALAMKWRALTGGSDGIGGLHRPELLGVSLADPSVMYWFVLAGFIVVFVTLRHLVRSQLGHSLVGVKENETRMRAMGYSTYTLKLISFTIAGAVGGIAGGLWGLFSGYVSPDSLSWGASGGLLLMTVLGGTGTLMGPAVGAGIFLIMKNWVSSHSDHWLLILGVTFIACVMFFRRGVYGTASDWLHQQREGA
jgi:branched-chain amino acid transport system permease protein